MKELHFHVAIQTCDIAARNPNPRYCGNDRSELTRKSVTSFFESLRYAQQRLLDVADTRLITKVRFFDDRSTTDTVDYLKLSIAHYTSEDTEIDLVRNTKPGLMASVRSCYLFMQQEGRDIVYQVQDDFLFQTDAIYQMISVFEKVKQDTGREPFVISHHHPYYIGTWYKYQQVPRVIVPGTDQYWLQGYEMGCTFLTGAKAFNKHWDIYEKFFATDLHDPHLEVDTFNRLFVDRGEINLVPTSTVAFHLQHESDRDPFVDWQPTWDAVPDLRNAPKD